MGWFFGWLLLMFALDSVCDKIGKNTDEAKKVNALLAKQNKLLEQIAEKLP